MTQHQSLLIATRLTLSRVTVIPVFIREKLVTEMCLIVIWNFG